MGAVSRNLRAAPIGASLTQVACPVTHIRAYKQEQRANSHGQLREKKKKITFLFIISLYDSPFYP